MLKGWKVKAICSKGGHGLEVYLVHDNGYEINIPNDKLKYFGYICHGPELGICNDNTFKYTEQEQNDAILDIISKELGYNQRTIDFHTVKQYLLNRECKIKVEKDAIQRVKSICINEFQDIVRYKYKCIEKDKIFKD